MLKAIISGSKAVPGRGNSAYVLPIQADLESREGPSSDQFVQHYLFLPTHSIIYLKITLMCFVVAQPVFIGI